MITIISDPKGLFEKGEQYPPADIYTWLAKGDLPEGLVVQGPYQMVVKGKEFYDLSGKPVREDRWYKTQRGDTRWRVLAILQGMLDRGENPGYREMAKVLNVSTGAIGWHLKKLEELGMVQRSPDTVFGTRTTEAGRLKLKELSFED